MERNLLIIACSNRKNNFGFPRPAWQVYDGVMYRTLKKVQSSGEFPKNLDIIIISAKFGVLLPSTPMPHYDLKMTTERAVELQPRVSSTLKQILKKNIYTQIIISMGNSYLQALQSTKWPPYAKVGYIPGKIGQKLHLTKEWIINPLLASKMILWIQSPDL